MGNFKTFILLFILLFGLSTWLVSACGDDDDDDSGSETDDDDISDDDDDSSGFVLTSSKFDSGDDMPIKYSCDNPDYDHGVSPHLVWANAPADTVFFALTMFDPDANDTAHWGVLDIPPTVTELADELRPDNSLPEWAWEVIVYTDEAEYAGPCPPEGSTHNYVFTIYALDESMPDFDTTPKLKDVMGLIEERKIDSASLTVQFGH